MATEQQQHTFLRGAGEGGQSFDIDIYTRWSVLATVFKVVCSNKGEVYVEYRTYPNAFPFFRGNLHICGPLSLKRLWSFTSKMYETFCNVFLQ